MTPLASSTRLRAGGLNAYPAFVYALEARPRNTVTVIIGLVLLWSVASLVLPDTSAGSFAPDPEGARLGPMTMLVAIASDRPATAFDARFDEHPDAVPALLSAKAGTAPRSAG